MKTLIAYGTRYGATAGTAEEIGAVLREQGFDVRVANLKREKVKDISEYDLVIIGSGMRIFRWVGEAEKFLQKFQKDLRQKKTAIFVSSGADAMLKHEGKTDEMEKAWRDYLVTKAEKYSLEPVMMAIFGGVWDFNQMGFPFNRTLEPMKAQIISAGIPETKPGVFDTRNWDEIRDWARRLADTLSQ